MAKSRIPAMPADDEAESRRSIPGRGGSNIPCRSPIIAVGDAWEPGFHFLGNYGSAISQPTSAPKATISTITHLPELLRKREGRGGSHAARTGIGSAPSRPRPLLPGAGDKWRRIGRRAERVRLSFVCDAGENPMIPSRIWWLSAADPHMPVPPPPCGPPG